MNTSPSIFRDALEFVSDGIVISDPAGAVQFVNGQIPKLFGYSTEEILGASIETLVPDRFKDDHVQHRVRYVAAPYERPMESGLALVGRRKDGSEFPVQIRLGPIKQGESLFVLAAIRDVTDRWHTVSEMAPAPAAANESTERSGDGQDSHPHAQHGVRAILTAVSDGIRQPLHSLALLNALLTKHPQLDDHTLSHAIRGQTDAIRSIARLVDSFLHFRRLDSAMPHGANVAVPLPGSLENLEAAHPSSESVPGDSSARKVLVLIGDPGAAQAACTLLGVTGHHTTVAHSLEEARAAAQFRRDIDVLLTEDRLADGTEAAELIAAIRGALGRRVKAIVMSDDMASLSGARRTLDSDIRFLRRPTSADELLGALQER